MACLALAACTEREPTGGAAGSRSAPAPAPCAVAPGASGSGAAASGASAAPSAEATAAASGTIGPDAGSGGDEPMQPLATQDELLALLTLPPLDAEASQRRETFLRTAIGPGTPVRMNQGNPELAKHEISKSKCLAGLSGIVLQTEEQRRICKGFDNMVPIYSDGHPESAKACIDVFEFPDRPCELPFVWAGAAQAKAVCRALGKRLCTDKEWVTACSADPAGGPRWKFAYGDEPDLTICNTHKSSHLYDDQPCDPKTIATAWKTCGTHTEPTGSFPRCRSRLGVFDQHGNVAEAMSRYDPVERKTVSQLKGSAFFYVDVARDDKAPATHETYPDHCAHDPRWHVQDLPRAWHVNYHLGFRCCLSLD